MDFTTALALVLEAIKIGEAVWQDVSPCMAELKTLWTAIGAVISSISTGVDASDDEVQALRTAILDLRAANAAKVAANAALPDAT